MLVLSLYLNPVNLSCIRELLPDVKGIMEVVQNCSKGNISVILQM